MKRKEKLGKPVGVRLTPATLTRLSAHARERGEEEIDIIRRAIANEIDRLDALIPDSTRSVLNRLHAAGLDFEQVANDAIDRKRAEDAQMRMAPVETALGVGAGR